MKIDWLNEKDEYISTFIEEGMVLAWLSCDATIEEIYLVCRKRGMDYHIRYSEFADVFMFIAENI